MPAVGGILPGDSNKEYPGSLTLYVTLACVIAAMGGLIFGYDIGISGGVTSMDSFLGKFFPSVLRKKNDDKTKNPYCQYDNQTLTMFTSSLYLAALLASLVASTVTRRFGRKLSMLFGGVLFCAGAIINGAAKAVWMLILGRILLGFGIGFSNQSVPLYLSEMAPYKYRGALNIGFQLSITIGILIANILNFFFAEIEGGWGWRLSLGGAVVPALIISIGSLILPNSPNSMIERGSRDEARFQLKRIRGVDDIDEEFNDLVAASDASKQVENPWRNLLQRKYRPHLTMAIMIPFFQQLTGINVIMFYAPVLFNTIGFGNNPALMSAVITGCVNVAATVVSIYRVDKWGRRFLFLEGGVQMLICQTPTMAIMIINVIMFYAPVLFNTIGFGNNAALMSAVIIECVNVAATVVSIYGVDKWGRRFLFLEGGVQMLICQAVVAAAIGAKFGVNGNPWELPQWYAIVVVLFICIYVAGFAWSWGPLGWLVPSEIFPLEIRSAAQSINVSVNMLFTFIVAQVFLIMLCHLKFGLFLFFAFFVLIMSIFIFFFLPETKGIPIEEMNRVWKSHWYWSRFVTDLPGGGVEMAHGGREVKDV